MCGQNTLHFVSGIYPGNSTYAVTSVNTDNTYVVSGSSDATPPTPGLQKSIEMVALLRSGQSKRRKDSVKPMCVSNHLHDAHAFATRTRR